MSEGDLGVSDTGEKIHSWDNFEKDRCAVCKELAEASIGGGRFKVRCLQ